MKQSLVRKDVKCDFDPLNKRFNILAIPDQTYSQHILDLIMRACIILHNIIIDDEKDVGYDDNYYNVIFIVVPPVTYETPTSLTTILKSETHLTYELMFLNI
jgi:hypothetical protein